MRGLGRRRVLPGHGPESADLEAVASGYLTHRHERLEQVRAALWDLGDEATTRDIVEYVYVDVGEELGPRASVGRCIRIDTLEIAISTFPNLSAVALTMPATAAGSLTSATQLMAFTPRERASSATASSVAPSLCPLMTTSAP